MRVRLSLPESIEDDEVERLATKFEKYLLRIVDCTYP